MGGKVKQKRQEDSDASSSLPFLTGPSFTKIKMILVVRTKFVEHFLCARHGSKMLHTLPNPNNDLDAAVMPIVQMKKLKQGFLDDLISDGAGIWSQAARPQIPILTTFLYSPVPSDNVERNGLCNLRSSKAFTSPDLKPQ